jgi:hypothetical protein
MNEWADKHPMQSLRVDVTTLKELVRRDVYRSDTKLIRVFHTAHYLSLNVYSSNRESIKRDCLRIQIN